MIEDIPQSDETPEDIPVGDVSGETGDVQESAESLTDTAGEEEAEILLLDIPVSHK